jgi:Sec-independent protein translocase protein TatA
MELLFVLFLAFLVFGPKRFQDLLSSLARAKTKLEEAGRGFESRLTTECSESSEHSQNAEDNFPRGIESGIARGNPTSIGMRNE